MDRNVHMTYPISHFVEKGTKVSTSSVLGSYQKTLGSLFYDYQSKSVHK